MPAGLLVDFGTQAQRAGGGVSRRIRLQHGVKIDEVRPDKHPFALAEVTAVGNRLLDALAAICGQAGKTSQALCHAQQLSSNSICVVARHAGNARLYATDGLRGQQSLDAGVLAVGHTADNVGGGLRFGLALRHTHDDGDRL